MVNPSVNPSTLYNAALARGRILFPLLQQRLDNPATHDVEVASLELNYHLENQSGWPGMPPEHEDAFENENLELDGGGWTTVTVNGRTSSRVAYSNFFAPGQGSIICVYNDKTQDGNQPRDRLEWSQVISQVYQKLALESLQPATNLRTIWRFWIVNDETQRILGEAKSFGHPRDESPWFTEYRPGDSGFFALLGCPNGKGIVRMLTDHADALGRKTIACIRVLKGTQTSAPPTMYFVLADCLTEWSARAKGFKRSVAGQRRAAKRQKKHLLQGQ